MERLRLLTVLRWVDALQFAMAEQVLQEAGIPCVQHGRTINSLEDPASVFVINALVFWSAAAVLDGFQVRGFLAALLGSVIYTVLGVIIESALERLFAK